jgi:hypothetical protein
VDVKMLTNPFSNKKIRLPVIGCLIFSFLLTGCSGNKNEARPVTIQWNGNKAESIFVPKELLDGLVKDSIEQFLHIQLANTPSPILGEYAIQDTGVLFRPLLPFTRGLQYEIAWKGKLIGELNILPDNTHPLPQVISIYPTNDTVPLNLLKIYIVFSAPMQEGEALQHITVLKNRRDTVPSVFLDLQPELWNKERTILTLWLDPGRIKRDLQPNIKMGSPLQEKTLYQLVISNDWRDAEGVSLDGIYRKEFFVGARDSISPDPMQWTLYKPAGGSKKPLQIDLHESLDYVLLKNTIRIADGSDSTIDGTIETGAAETVLVFTPSAEWRTGDYTIEIESRLEDLAGNNLGRLFDQDLTRKSAGVQKKVYKKTFRIP